MSVNSETTEIKEQGGWVFYDADCVFCSDLAARFDKALLKRRFRLVPLQTPWVRKRLGLSEGQTPAEMSLLSRGGENLGGADAVIFLACRIWWAWPLCALAHLPGARKLLHAAYRRIAARRNCPGGVCERRKTSLWPAWMTLIILPMLAFLVRERLPAWAFMWLLAGAIFLGCKWLTLYREKQRAGHVAPLRALGYLLAWPGMDARQFLGEPNDNRNRCTMPAVCCALGNTALGAGLLWGASRTATEPLLAGWIGMFGLISILHFGLFHLIALAWQTHGIDARPLMDSPIQATSLGEFWGRRWNGAFNRLAYDFAFRPLARTLGSTLATFGAFTVSGLVHELVISLPARGGYGLPLAYFLLQGLGVVAERARAGRLIGLGHGAGGWLFTMLVTAVPAFWIFHPPFVQVVILPFLQVIHAL
jgi:alginate O-acetyltransferase complex protein AlgI